MKKRIVCLTLALLMTATQVVSVSASREDELREEQAITSQQLDATYSRMDELAYAKSQLENEISELDSNLVSVMVSIDTLKGDIDNKEVDIIKTKQDLAKAQKARDKQYESMKLFVEAEIRRMGKKNLWIGPSLGDWLAMGKGIAWQAMHNNPVSNAFIVHDLKVISETAERLGKREDAARYRRQLAATTDAYIKKFVSKKGIVAKDYQSAYIMALKFVLPEGELRERVKKNFVANIRKNGLQTGFFATEHLLPLLVEAGEQKLAYDVLLQENCPGWMYQVKCGATTTWERWDALKPDGTVNEEKMAGSGENMVSFNHYAFGSVGEFYYQYILGIRPEKPGFAKLHFAPYPDERLGGVSGSYLSVAGKIESAWRYGTDGCHIRLATPVEAVVLLPDGRSENVPAGTYEWTVKSPSGKERICKKCRIFKEMRNLSEEGHQRKLTAARHR